MNLDQPMPRDDQREDASIDWEAFYTHYRKPDYVPGYEIVNKLGSGSFGVVYKARKQSIGKLFAIKFLRVDDIPTREAILKELAGVRYFAQIDHPNLVSIEDRGQVDGIPYIVMGYAGEETLKNRLEKGPLGEQTALRIFIQVCRGVYALHERSLIHFDIKPANVFLRGSGVKVGDYGLSRLLTESRNTLSFGRGTPYYMAPELARLHGDHRSDIYSLGVLLFECLSGEVPFHGSNEYEVMKHHQEDEVEFPEAIEPRFRKLIARAMAKDPADRFPSIAQMLACIGERVDFADPIGIGAGPSVAKEAASNHVAGRRESGREPAPEGGVEQTHQAPGGSAAARESRRPVARRAHKRLARHSGGVVASGLGVLIALLEMVTVVVALPVRFIAQALGGCLEFLVLLPFRLLEWAVRIGIFLLGVGLFFLIGMAIRKVVLAFL